MVYKSLMTLDNLAFESAPHLAPLHLYDFPLPVYPVVSAHGCELSLAGGEQLVDGMSSRGRRSTATITHASMRR